MYDLKGSVHGRFVRREPWAITEMAAEGRFGPPKLDLSEPWSAERGHYSGTLHDQDFEEDTREGGLERKVELDFQDKLDLLRQLFEDARFLAEQRVMDYSLLVCRAK